MATILSTDLFIPDVFADFIAPIIEKKLILAPLATVNPILEGQPGDEITTSRWNYSGRADELTENVPITLRKLSMSQTSYRIKEAGLGFEITDTATLTALGNPDSAITQNLALGIADKVDFDLRTAAELTETVGTTTYAPLAVPAANKPLSWARLVRGFGLLGDGYDPSSLSLLISSAQHMQLMVDPLFVSSQTFGEGAVIVRGFVGRIGQIPVFVSDRATDIADVDSVTAGNQAGHRALLIKSGALELSYKRRPLVEKDRDILSRKDVAVATVHYGVKRVDDKGVVIIPTNSVIPED